MIELCKSDDDAAERLPVADRSLKFLVLLSSPDFIIINNVLERSRRPFHTAHKRFLFGNKRPFGSNSLRRMCFGRKTYARV